MAAPSVSITGIIDRTVAKNIAETVRTTGVIIRIIAKITETTARIHARTAGKKPHP